MSKTKKKQKTMEELLKEALVPEEEQPYEVPGNWVWVKFDRSVSTVSNRSKQLKQREYKEVGRYPVIDQGQKLISGFSDNEELVFTGELPVIIFGDHTRIIKWADFKFVQGADGTKILKPESFFYPKFIYYLLQVINLPDKGYSRHFKYLKDTNLPCPPIQEQQRIVEKVERILIKIDEAKRLIEEAKETFELRRAAIIKAILEEELPTGNTPKGWKLVKIEDVFDIFGGGTPRKSNKSYWGGNIPWISAKDMKTRYISKTQDYITEEGLNNSSAKLANENSVVIVVRSGILQRTLPVALLLTKCTVNQDLKVFDSGNKYLNKYFMWYIVGNEKRILQAYTKSGTTVNSIEFEKFKSHEILLPPLQIMEEKVKKIESLINKEKEILKAIESISSLEVTKATIMSKAFRGEFGTNDPTEESAIELLKEVLQEKVK